MQKIQILFTGLIMSFSLLSCSNNTTDKNTNSIKNKERIVMPNDTSSIDTITLGAGCFWCVEAVFQNLNGVISVTSGYSGGEVKNPTYKEVCSGTTGHAEVCQLVYDKSKLSLSEILEVFFKTHDPTTLNRQGNDYGTQYRSAIFYHSDDQKKTAQEIINEVNTSGAYEKPIVTEVTAFTNFYKAEDYHQNYFNENGNEPYCKFVIQPKLDKFKKVFEKKLKAN